MTGNYSEKLRDPILPVYDTATDALQNFDVRELEEMDLPKLLEVIDRMQRAEVMFRGIRKRAERNVRRLLKMQSGKAT